MRGFELCLHFGNIALCERTIHTAGPPKKGHNQYKMEINENIELNVLIKVRLFAVI